MAGVSWFVRYGIAFVLCIVLSACGGSTTPDPGVSVCPDGGCVKGQVVDTAAKPVSGMRVALGGRSVVTDPSGNFALSNITPGTHRLQGSGGTANHYVLDVPSVGVSAGHMAELPAKTAYQMHGMLIIDNQMAGASGTQGHALGLQGLSHAFPARMPYEGTVQRQIVTKPSTDWPDFSLLATGGADLVKENGGYFYLQWEKAEGVGREYSIKYLGTSPGGTGQEVWTSTDIQAPGHPRHDPGYDPDHPVAYLDLGYELQELSEDLDSAVGEVHYFRVDTPGVDYPPIGLSLAIQATGIAKNLRVDRSGSSPQFKWDAVDNAAGYQVLVYDENRTKVWTSGDTLLTVPEVPAPSANLQPGKNYLLYVDTHFSEDGWVQELTRSSRWIGWVE